MNPLNALFPHLPRQAEEGALHTTVAVAELSAALQRAGLDADAARAVLALLERLLDSLCLLDSAELQAGRWGFVSFSAQLCALSLLRVLADSQQILLQRDFWEAKSHSGEIDAQRELLRTLETRRARFNPNAAPVRYVYVAWALLKLDGKFLLHHREDRHRPDSRSGNYVLVGGRTNVRDLTDLGDTATLLAALQSADSAPARRAAEHTLTREVREEIGLEAGPDYSFSLWRELPPYREVEGAGANHAYTEYVLRVYHLNLTQAGLFRLWLGLAERAQQLAWFSAAEMAAGRSVDGGKTAYLTALRRAFGDDAAALEETLSAVAESYAPTWRLSKATEALTLEADGVWQGATGKEKRLPLALSAAHGGLLLGLAAHAKGFRFVQFAPEVTALPHGWVELDAPELARVGLELAKCLRLAGLPLLESAQERYFRLAVAAPCLFFGAAWFSAVLAPMESGKWWLSLRRETLDTPLGRVEGCERQVELSAVLAVRLQAVAGGEIAELDDANLKKSVRETVENKLDIEAMGLRKLLRVDGKCYGLACSFVVRE